MNRVVNFSTCSTERTQEAFFFGKTITIHKTRTFIQKDVSYTHKAIMVD